MERSILGTMYGRHIYKPPCGCGDGDGDGDDCKVINLREVSCLSRCHVSCEYGRLENRGLVFLMSNGQEIQVNYLTPKMAQSEFEYLSVVLGDVDRIGCSRRD
jgi:hypothetical protein